MDPLVGIRKMVSKLADKVAKLVSSKNTPETERRIQFLMKRISKYLICFLNDSPLILLNNMTYLIKGIQELDSMNSIFVGISETRTRC